MSEFILTSVDDLTMLSSQVYDHFAESTKPVRVKLSNASNRSLNQNSTYWMWLGELSHQIKLKARDVYSTDDLHEYFKARFCPDKKITLGNKTISVKSTSRLDPGEMHFYMNQLFDWAVNAGFNLTIPIESEYRKIIERQSE